MSLHIHGHEVMFNTKSIITKHYVKIIFKKTANKVTLQGQVTSLGIETSLVINRFRQYLPLPRSPFPCAKPGTAGRNNMCKQDRPNDFLIKKEILSSH